MIKTPSPARKFIGLKLTAEQYHALAEEADKVGTTPTGLFRFRLFGRIKGLRHVRRPCYNTRLLGDALGQILNVSGALNQIGSNIGRIAERLDRKQCDLFGLDGAVRRFEQLGCELHKLLNLIDAVIKGRPQARFTKNPPPRM